MKNAPRAVLALAALLLAALAGSALRRGWSQMGTDFPNYYTAARLTRERAPLEQFYDWVWFQRQIHYAGIHHQLGGYIPHTPATMLPMVPLSYLPPQRAKQVWLACGVLFLLASVLLLSRLSGFPVAAVAVVVLLAHAAVRNNFLIGQYYLFLLLLLTAGLWCLLRGREAWGGVLVGTVFALKLYTAPFLLFFAVRRQWRAFWGFVAAAAGFGLVAAAWFGPHAVWFFLTTVLLRGVDGTVNDPYNPGWASMAAFLRHTFMAEPEWNPHPAWNAPWLALWLRNAYTLGVLAAALAVVRQKSRIAAESALGGFIVVLFVLSPNTATYHFVLLAPAVVLLLRGASAPWGAGLLLLYTAVELPLYSWDARFFPKAWLLLAMLLYTGWRFRAAVQWRPAAVAAAVVLAIAGADAWRRIETGRPAGEAAAVERGRIYAAAASESAAGLVFEKMGWEEYMLRAGDRDLVFDGDAFHPAQTEDGSAVYFELVSAGGSRIARFERKPGVLTTVEGPAGNPREPAISRDGRRLAFIAGDALVVAEGGAHTVLARGEVAEPAFFPDGARIAFTVGRPGRRRIESVGITGENRRALVTRGDCMQPAVSADGTRLAFACAETGARQVWVRDLARGEEQRLTGSRCTNGSPAWSRDGRSLVYATDCGRGLGLTGLYRIDF